ncbi:hypothetical protein ACHAPT_005843 [Fusarium lateritium]
MCRERFLRELLPKDETLERVCEALGDRGEQEQQRQQHRSFRALYCCDSQLCGVDNLGERGRDPNVNWIINACQEIGHHSIVDPGPPDADYVCDPESTYGGDPYCHKAQPADRAENEAPESVSSTSQASTSEDATSKRSTTASETSTSAPVQSSMPDTTYSTSSDPSLVTSSSKEQDGKDEAGLPLGVKITIAILSVVILAALVILVVCLVRRRKSRRIDIRRLIKHPTSPPPADSPTPLVSPTLSHTDADGVPLTPPARLRERKFLPTPSEQSLSPHRDRSGFPASPLCSPTSSNLTPRHERTPKIYSTDQVPAVPMIVMTAPEGGPTSRNDGSASFSGVTPPASVRKMPLGHGSGSPPRPPRSRDGLFKILVSPGPPPTRALPSTPPNRPSTPTKPLSSPPRKGATVCPPPAHQLTKDIVLSAEARELRDMTESYAQDAGRHSGGSWSGIAGSSLIKGRSASSPVMEEADLERLGGRY